MGTTLALPPTLISPSPQVEYLLKKICTAMNVELNSCELDDYLSQEPQGQGGLTVWQFLDMVNSGRLLRGIEQEAISMAVEEVYQEVIEDVLKQARSPRVPGHKLSLGGVSGFLPALKDVVMVLLYHPPSFPCPVAEPRVPWAQGYLWKKGQLRRNWSERWFMLKPSVLSYYMSEERKEKKGSIALDKHCCVEVQPGPRLAAGITPPAWVYLGPHPAGCPLAPC